MKTYYHNIQQSTSRYVSIEDNNRVHAHYKTFINLPSEVVQQFKLQKGTPVIIKVLDTTDGKMKLEIEQE